MSKRAPPDGRAGAPPRKLTKQQEKTLANVRLGRRKDPAASERKWAALLSVGAAEDAPGAGAVDGGGGGDRGKVEEESGGAAAASAGQPVQLAGSAGADFSLSVLVETEKIDRALASATSLSDLRPESAEHVARPWWNNVDLYSPASYDVFEKIYCFRTYGDVLWVSVTPRDRVDKERDRPESPATVPGQFEPYGYYRGTDARLELTDGRIVLDDEPIFASPDIEHVAVRGPSGRWELRTCGRQSWSIPTYLAREMLCKSLEISEAELQSHVGFGVLILVDDVLFAPNGVDKMAYADFRFQVKNTCVRYNARLVRVNVSAYPSLSEVASHTHLKNFWIPQFEKENERRYNTAYAEKVLHVIQQITLGAPTQYHRNTLFLKWFELARTSKLLQTQLENVKRKTEKGLV